jgi:VTC domain
MGGVLGSADDPRGPATAVDPFEYEQRFVLTRAQAIAFYGAVGARATLELYDRERPISFTRTTYLDTDDFTYFRSCEGPVARRLRVREYAVAPGPGETPALSGICFLELKQNAGTTRSKIRVSAPSALLRSLIESGGQLDESHIARLGLDPPAALEALCQELGAELMAPRLTTWYRRTCMSGESGRVRITLDENLTFCQPQPLGAPGEPAVPRDVVASGPARILEIKHWGETPEWLAHAVEGLSAAPNFSKFRMGMLALWQHGAAPTLPVGVSGNASPTLFILNGSVA